MQRAVGVELFLHELLERLMELQRRPDRAIGVVLVGDRCAEQRQDRIAEDLVDGAAERLDVDDQSLERGVDQSLEPLRIEVLRQAGIADDVGEQHRDDPPLLGRRGHHLVPAERAEARTFGQRSQT